MTTIRLVDINPAIVASWEKAFADFPQVERVNGSMLEQNVDVWVTPTNSKGNMSGGLDAAIVNHLGPFIQMAVRAEIDNEFNGHLPVGRAICVLTKTRPPRYLVSTPTMEGESDDLRRTKNTALACAAAFQAIYQANDMFGEAIDSIAIPGLGAGTGKVDPEKCAELMLIGYKLFRRKRFSNFDDMLQALNEELIAADMALVAAAKGTEEDHPHLKFGTEEADEDDNGPTDDEIEDKAIEKQIDHDEEVAIIRASYVRMTDVELQLHGKKAGFSTDTPRDILIDELTERAS